jgi:hypothetical protein
MVYPSLAPMFKNSVLTWSVAIHMPEREKGQVRRKSNRLAGTRKRWGAVKEDFLGLHGFFETVSEAFAYHSCEC